MRFGLVVTSLFSCSSSITIPDNLPDSRRLSQARDKPTACFSIEGNVCFSSFLRDDDTDCSYSGAGVVIDVATIIIRPHSKCNPF